MGAIEVLHYEGLLATGPELEVWSRSQKEVVRGEFDTEFAQKFELFERRRFGGVNRQVAKFFTDDLQPIDSCLGFDVANPVAFGFELRGKVAGRRDEKEEAFGVPGAAGCHPGAFNQHNEVGVFIGDLQHTSIAI